MIILWIALFFYILQFSEQIKTTQLAEKETFYQQQIKEYQAKIEQITEEEQNVYLKEISL